jgi:hypothetical protein
MGWVVLARFNPSGNRRLQLKTEGNTQETTGNKAVAAGNRTKAINDFIYYSNKVKSWPRY